MMHYTLLPPPEKRALIHEYRVRILIVCCFIFSLTGIICIGSLFPAYMKAYNEKNDTLALAASSNKKSATNDTWSISAVLVDDAALLKTVNTGVSQPRISELVESLTSLRSDIQISSLAFTEDAHTAGTSTTYSVVILGVAPTRESLIAWQSRLEDLAGGQKVDLPIGELAKDKDISFSMSVGNLKI